MIKRLTNSLLLILFLCGPAGAYIFISTQVGKETNYVISEEVILVQGGVVNEDGDELAVDYNTYAHKGTSYADADFTFECNDGEGWDTINLTYASGDDTKQWKFDTASTVVEYGWVCRLSYDGSADSVERTDDNDIELAAFDDDEVTNRSTQGTDDVAPQLMSVTILESGEAIEAAYNEAVVIGDGGTGTFSGGSFVGNVDVGGDLTVDGNATVGGADARRSVATYAELMALSSPSDGDVVFVTGTVSTAGIAGNFIYDADGAETTDNGYYLESGAGVWIRQHDGFIHPEWWGALADNSTDSYSAINTAIELDKGPVLLCEGIYRISQPIVITNDGAAFHGSGAGVTIIVNN